MSDQIGCLRAVELPKIRARMKRPKIGSIVGPVLQDEIREWSQGESLCQQQLKKGCSCCCSARKMVFVISASSCLTRLLFCRFFTSFCPSSILCALCIQTKVRRVLCPSKGSALVTRTLARVESQGNPLLCYTLRNSDG